MPIRTRPAEPDDAIAMCDLLNPIIAEGGTTAHRRPFDEARMRGHYLAPPRLVACTTAWEDNCLMGFQTLERADPDWSGPDLVPPDWGLIATFVRIGAQGKGIGQALFTDTRRAAFRAGIETIDATIRADNRPGLGYYAKLGFRDYDVLPGGTLSDGTPVDRVRKRYDIAAQT